MHAKFLLGLAMAPLAVSLAFANDPRGVEIPGDSVIPVVFRTELNFKESRIGDGFTSTVKNGRDLPPGTRIEGRIMDIRPQTKREEASMDLEFTRIILPDGTVAHIHGVPISLDKKYVNEAGDGRYYAKKTDAGAYVAAGAATGYIVGSSFHRPLAGTVVGAIIGLFAGSNRHSDVLIAPGQLMGCLVEQPVHIDPTTGVYYSHRGRYGRRFGAYSGPPEEIAVTFRGRDLTFPNDAAPYREGSEVMVPLDSVKDQMRITVENLNDSKAIVVETDDMRLRLEQDSSDYRLNDKEGKFSQPVVKRNGVVYVPIEALAMLKVGRIAINGTNVDDGS